MIIVSCRQCDYRNTERNDLKMAMVSFGTHSVCMHKGQLNGQVEIHRLRVRSEGPPCSTKVLSEVERLTINTTAEVA